VGEVFSEKKKGKNERIRPPIAESGAAEMFWPLLF
jgi:hypothetical protein